MVANTGIASEIVTWDALELSRAIRERQVTCVEVMTAFLDQIALHNPTHNAIVSLRDRDELLAEAAERDAALDRGEYRGWMHGFPQAPKDLTSTAGIRTTMGSRLFEDNVPAADSILVERMRSAGPILIGKTNTPEFGLGSHTFNDVFGATRNAYAPDRTAGGSSGGAAVALALRMLPVADGSDAMGSLRNPAGYNNVLGFRPSWGRVPSGPAPDVFYQQLSTEGPMARSVADLAMLLSTLAGYDDRAPLSNTEDPAAFAQPLDANVRGRRVAWLGDLGGYLAIEPEVLALCRGALEAIEGLGCVVEEVVPDYPFERSWSAWTTLRSIAQAGRHRENYTDAARRAMLKPEIIWEVERGMTFSGLDFHQAALDRSAWYAAVRALFQRYDYLALPSAQLLPFDVTLDWPHEVAGRQMDTYHRWMEVVLPASLPGLPAISVPAGFSEDGRTIGLQLVAPAKADLAVLQIAAAYEAATEWVSRRLPPVLTGE
jgi:amidase